MAVTPKTDEAFLREVDEELRRDQAARLWRRYGMVAIGGVIAALAVFAGLLYWHQASAAASAADVERLQALADKATADPAGATRDAAAMARSDRPVVRAVAEATQASLAAQQNDTAGAAALFDKLAADTTVPQPLRDMATIRAVTARFDTLPPQQVVERLRPLAVKGGPWFGSAGELTAMAYLKMNRRDLAGRLFQQIAADEGVPSSVRQRAVQMAGATGVDAVKQNEDTKAQ